MLLKGHNNLMTVEAVGRIKRAACWQSSSLVSFGGNSYTPFSPLSSMMLRDKGQQPRTAESIVGDYFFNQHC